MFFGVSIVLGTILLWLPWSSTTGKSIPLLDALFTATSAVCVTGLTLFEMGTTLSPFGQVVLLALFQIGGLGYMTLATVTAVLGGRLALQDRMSLHSTIETLSFENLASFIKYVVKVTLMLELVGAILLTLLWSSSLGWVGAAYWGLFHSVSAFCNAGFTLFGGSLTSQAAHSGVLLVMAALIILGGLGFFVLNDAYIMRRKGRISTHSKVVLFTTLSLILISWIVILISEYDNPVTLGAMPWVSKLTNAFFMSVAPRTAGFSTVSIVNLTQMSLFVILLMMFVGASPGGTGGGIKTTSFTIILATIWATFRGRKHVNLFHRRMPLEIISKSFAVSAMAVIFICSITLILLATEGRSFFTTFFEVTSAFSTVGLSAGLTGELSTFGKLILVITMFVGRLGPLTVGLATLKEGQLHFRYAQEKIMVG